jgi:hypothetical protein
VTTACFLGGDLAALSNHAVGFLGCSTLLQQRSSYERKGPTKQQTRYALYTQLSNTREREKAPDCRPTHPPRLCTPHTPSLQPRAPAACHPVHPT